MLFRSRQHPAQHARIGQVDDHVLHAGCELDLVQSFSYTARMHHVVLNREQVAETLRRHGITPTHQRPVQSGQRQ